MTPDPFISRSRISPIIPFLVIFIYATFFLAHVINSPRPPLDLGSFYWSSQLTFNQHHSPYDLATLSRLSEATGQKVFPYLYPPPSLLLFFPLSWTTPRGAEIAMAILNHACVLVIGWILFVKILGYTPRSLVSEWVPGGLLIYFLTSRGIGLTIDYGQINVIVLTLLCLCWWAIKSDAPPLAIALPLALATLLKTYPALFILLLLLQKQYRSAFWTMGLLMGVAVLSLAVLPDGLWPQWLNAVAPTGGFCQAPYGLHSPAVEANQGINGFVSRLCLATPVGPALVHSRRTCVALGYAMAGAILAVTTWTCRSSKSPDPNTIDLRFSAFLIASFLVAPLASAHHLAYITPAAIVALTILSRDRQGISKRRKAAILLAAAVIAWPLSTTALPLSGPAMVAANSIIFYAVVGLWAWIIHRLPAEDFAATRRYGRSPPPIVFPIIDSPIMIGMTHALNLPIRPRRLRQNPQLRSMLRRVALRRGDIIVPLFVREGTGIRQEVPSMPGVYQMSLDVAVDFLAARADEGFGAFLAFGVIDRNKKDPAGSAALDENNIVCQLLRRAKDRNIPMAGITDLCFCEYTSHGHCGPLAADGCTVHNDRTVELLVRQAVNHARAGAAVIAPSGMMDGAVAALRGGLDAAGFPDVALLAYSVKYASAFYGPFRDAADSAPSFGDRHGYQMDPARGLDEALLEAQLDVEQGADMVMVKPAGAYLDVLSAVRGMVDVPVVAYQVSGEYAMLQAAGRNGWIDHDRAALESLIAIKRAGADLIITYYAELLAKLLPR